MALKPTNANSDVNANAALFEEPEMTSSVETTVVETVVETAVETAAVPATFTTAPTAVAVAPAAKPASEADTNKVVCRRVEAIGTRLASKRVCRTKGEWDAEAAANRQDLERSQTQRWKSD